MSAISLRLPNSLHDRLRELAEREGISINQLLTLAAAEKVASILTFDYLEERARSADLRAFDALLARVPAAPPAPGDEHPLPSDQARPHRGSSALTGEVREPPARYSAKPRKLAPLRGRRKK